MTLDRFTIDDRLWMVTQPTGVGVYDYDFRRYHDCRTPYNVKPNLPAVARVGAIADYDAFYGECGEEGIDLVHTPEEHVRCSTLPGWYPLIEEYTPRSRWYSEPPSVSEIESHFTFPIFIKGVRQTSRHRASMHIIYNREEYAHAIREYEKDDILHWQDLTVREYIELRPVGGGVKGKIPASFEYRTFWWRNTLVGEGPYWWEADKYKWTEVERSSALAIAKQVADRVNCAFLVIDLALTAEGQWIVIECNDGMESGYAGASPFSIWKNILDIEGDSIEGSSP